MRAFLTVWLSLSVCGGLAAAPITEIVMGFNPTENADVVDANAKAFSDYYKKKTGISVKSFIATDYTALIEALRSNRIHFAWLPPFSYVKAEQMADAEVLLKCVRKGKAHFYSAIIVRTDRPYHKIEDLKGKNIAWVDPTSASGHIYPKASLMRKLNLADVDSFFGRQLFAGSHEALVLSVLNGTVDAGATFANDAEGKDGAWNTYVKGADSAKLRAIYVTEPIPGDTMATTKKFAKEHADIQKQMVATLVEMGKTDEGKKILSALYHIDSMVPATSKDYEPVRAAAKKVKID